MTEDELNETSQALVRALRAEFDRVLAELGPKLDSRPEPQMRDPAHRNVQVAQNVLRTCLEATLERLLPYEARTPIELAIRLASYALSVLPIEAQVGALASFMDAFPAAHARRLSQGIRINAEWDTEGRVRPNFPNGDS